MRRVLVVYEIIPEETKFYLETVDDEALGMLRACHGKFQNSSALSVADDAALGWLEGWLSSRKEVELEQPVVVPENTTVIWTGFML